MAVVSGRKRLDLGKDGRSTAVPRSTELAYLTLISPCSRIQPDAFVSSHVFAAMSPLT